MLYRLYLAINKDFCKIALAGVYPPPPLLIYQEDPSK